MVNVCASAGVNACTGISTRKNRLANQLVYCIFGSVNSFALYSPTEDAWGVVSNPALGTFAAGACMETSAIGPSGTATAGTTTTLTTNLTIPIDLRGYQIRITGGPGAGDVRTILSNTLGANSVITVSSAFSTSITSSSTYTLLTGRVYLFGGGTLGASTFRVYDFATNTTSSLTVTGLPATFGTDGQLIGTPSIVDNGVVTSHATGTATGGTSTTLVNAAKNWATNQWANAYQVRITGGTGAGQTRIILSNTTTTLTVSAAWATNPDATSVYSIEGNDDYLYLLGNGAVTLYRYSISGNSWSTLSPGVARGGAAGAACVSCVVEQCPEADWTNESAIINGRRLYSWRGGNTATLDYYDIPSNAWTNALGYGPLVLTATTGVKGVDYKGKWYMRNGGTSQGTAFWYVYDFATNQLLPWNSFSLLASSTAVGTFPFTVDYIDGATTIPFLYAPTDNATQIAMMRTLIG